MAMDAPPRVRTRVPTYPPPATRERILDFIFPPTCVRCRRIGRWLCEECWETMEWTTLEACDFCGRRWFMNPCGVCRATSNELDSAASVAEFHVTPDDSEEKDAARACVHALKYHGRHAISSMMGTLMAEQVRDLGASLVVPVSLHPSRRRERGYDQAALLARVVARRLDLPCDVSALRRTRRTKQQATLEGDKRRKNVEGAFAAEERVQGETIILIDDVLTTGATMDAAAHALREHGAISVIGLVFGHVG